MKKITFLLLSAILIFGALSCQREVSVPDEKPARYATLQVNVGRYTEGVDSQDTKSIVSSDVENFHKAILFAMNPSTKKVHTYGSNAGDLEGQPIIVETSEKTFNWALPMETRMDIYALVNYGDIDVSTYKSKGTNLTISDLEGITFSCSSANELAKLEQSSYGLPMAGITEIQATDIQTGEETISIKAKKLFARYNLYLDLSDLEASNSSVVAESAVIYNMNNTVHFFKEGDKKSGSNDVSKYDRATEDQLEVLQAGGNSNQVVFYVLENMQGDMSGATSWQTVYRDLGEEKVKYCTYLNFNVNVVNPQGRAESRNYRIYLGKTDMKSNFDVQRNYDKTIKLAIKDLPTANYFLWTNSSGNSDYSTLTVGQEEDITLYFKSDLEQSSLSFKVYNADTGAEIDSGYSFGSPSLNTSTHLGSVKFTPSSSINVGTKLKLIGGTEDINDAITVAIYEPIVLTASVPARRIQFERFNITCIISQSNHIKLLKQIAPDTDWDALVAANKNALYTVNNLSLIRDNLAIRTAEGSSSNYFGGVIQTGMLTVPNPVSNPTTLRLIFSLVNTEMVNRAQNVEIYNKNLGNSITNALNVTSTHNLVFEPITDTSSPYDENGYTGEVISSGNPSYNIDLEGATNYVYLKPMGYNPNNSTKIAATIVETDLTGYELTVENDEWYIDFGERGYNPQYDDPVDIDSNGAGTEWFLSGNNLSYIQWEYALCSYSGIVFGDWATRYGTYDAFLTKRDNRTHKQNVSLNALDIYLTNPRTEWFDLEHFSWQDIDNYYYVDIDGTSDYINVLFGQEQGDFSFPLYGFMPEILSVGNVTTGEPGVKFYGDFQGERDIEGLTITNDLHNYGMITIGKRLYLNGDPDESIDVIWAKVKCTREFVIYAGYQFSQITYLTSSSTPINAGNLSRFIPYLYAPNITLTGTTLSNMVRTTATVQTGINAVNPTEEFYKATCASEHWWHGGNNYVSGATDHSGSTLWDCEYADDERSMLQQNKVVVYASPKTVSSRGELSYYELQYAGPVVSANVNYYLGHHGHHSDDIFSFRSVAYWNEPAFEFSTSGIPSSLSPIIKTSGSEKYLQLGDYTKVRFFWRKKGKMSLGDSNINAYDTRWPMKNSFYCYVWTSTFKSVGYFGDQTASLSASYSTPYYDPRRSTLEKLKLYFVSIPFYRKLSSGVIKAADGGSITGSYTDEDIVGAHDFGHAIGGTDSFWVPGNQIN